MFSVRTCLVLLVIASIASCTPQSPPYRPALDKEGEILLYLQPMPMEAQRLSFGIESVSALREDGSSFPFSLSLEELKGAELVGKQKQLGSAIVPPGRYTGISIRVKNASVQREEGTAAYLVTQESVKVEHEFIVRKGQDVALFLTFDPAKSVKDNFSFTPAFTLASYTKELRNLLGFISNSDLNNISVFNKVSMLILDSIATGREPRGIALDKTRGLAYVALSGDDAVQIIDVFSDSTLSRIRLNLGDEPREIAITGDGATAVTANYGSNTASIIDTAGQFEAKRLSVGEGPVSVVTDPAGLKAYIFNSMSNSISVVDLARKEVGATITLDETPYRGDFSGKGDSLYVITMDSPNLLVIDPATLTVKDKIFVGLGALSIKVNTRTNLIYIGKRDNEISVIDPFALMSIDMIGTRSSVKYLTIDAEENALLALEPESGRLQKINTVSKRVMGEAEIGQGAYAVVVMGER